MIDLFTLAEVKAAKGKSINEIMQLLVKEEAMARIDKETGQENNLRYMAYRLQYFAESRGDF